MQNNKRLKRLCLPLLALVGVMAINASAAQATWTLLENEEATDHLSLEVTALLGELLVPDLNIAIHCTGGTGSALLQANPGLTVVAGTASVNFTGCKVLNNKFCTVTIHEASGEGELAEEGGEISVVASSEEFTNVLLTGAFCTLPKENPVNGSVRLTILNPLTDSVVHLVDVDEEELWFNAAQTQEALLHDAENPETGVLAHVETASGQTWAIHH